MAEWKGKTRGGVLGYQIFVWTLKHAGLRFAYTLLRLVTIYYLFFAWKSNRIIWDYLRNKQKWSFWKSLTGIYGSYYVFGQTLLDKVAAMAGMSHCFTFDVEDEKYLLQMVEEKTGGILIGAHLGNWDMAGNMLNRLKSPFNIMMFDGEHQAIKKYLDTVLKEKNIQVIAVGNDFSHLFELDRAFHAKELVCMHGDRFVEGGKTAKVQFMGFEAEFPLGPFALACKYKIPYSFVFAMKEKGTRYHFFATEPKIHSGKPQELLELYAQNLEKMLKLYPLQWFNYYSFWKN